MRALITRPKEDSTAIAKQLEELGIQPVLEPLMEVELVAEAVRRGLEMQVVGKPQMVSSNFVNGIQSLTVELLGAR